MTDDDQRNRCCAPNDAATGRCPERGVPMAPFPLCVRHLAMTMEFVNRQAGTGVNRGRGRMPSPAHTRGIAGTVYYFRVGALVKIGWTSNMQQRIYDYPPDTVVLGSEPGDRELETKRHRQFAHVLAHGQEWFHPCEEITEHVATLKAGRPAETRRRVKNLRPNLTEQ